MFKIEQDGTISINRGDKAIIGVQGNNGTYEFQAEDIVKLRIFDKKGYDKEPVLEKEIKVKSVTTEVDINLIEEDTLFSPESNKGITYWYSISLNGNVILGYDEDGAKEFIIYPAKGENNG